MQPPGYLILLPILRVYSVQRNISVRRARILCTYRNAIYYLVGLLGGIISPPLCVTPVVGHATVALLHSSFQYLEQHRSCPPPQSFFLAHRYGVSGGHATRWPRSAPHWKSLRISPLPQSTWPLRKPFPMQVGVSCCVIFLL